MFGSNKETLTTELLLVGRETIFRISESQFTLLDFEGEQIRSC